MSNVNVIRQLYATTGAGDFATFAKLCRPDIEWVQNVGFPYGGRHRGVDQVVEGVFRTLARHWEGFAFDADEMLETGDSVVVLGRYSGRHRQTGKSFAAAAAHVFSLRDGRVAGFRQYTDTALIREAAEL